MFLSLIFQSHILNSLELLLNNQFKRTITIIISLPLSYPERFTLEIYFLNSASPVDSKIKYTTLWIHLLFAEWNKMHKQIYLIRS